MFCTKCGQELPDGSAFCTKCGAKLDSRASKENKPQSVEAAQDGGNAGEEVPAAQEAAASAGAAAQAPAATTASAKAASASSAATAASAATGAAVSPTPHLSGRPKSRTNKPVIFAVLAAAVLVIAAVVYAVFFSPYNIDSTTFPDDTLRRTISRSYDSDRDGKLSRSEAAEVTKLDFSDSEIENLKGIELLPNLKSLNLSNCGYVESVDVSKNGALEELLLRGTDVQELDVSHNGHLAKLDIVGCAIESLDLSHNREMKTLNAAGSALDSLNVSGCENLKSIDVRSTELTELDVSGAKSLEAFLVDESVDVTGVENTHVREQWVLTSASMSGAHGPAYPVMQGMGETSTKYIEFTYNTSNQVSGYRVETSYPYASSGSSTETVSFSYDNGRVTSIEKSSTSTDSRGRTNYSSYAYGYSYNDNGQLSSYYSRYKNNSPTYYYYSYDENGRQTSSDSYRFGYDDMGRLVTVTYKSSGKTFMTISYDSSNRVEKIAYDGSDASYTFTYDMAGRCTTRHYQAASGSYAYDASYDVNYSYDSAGNMTKVEVVSTEGVVSGTVTFEYDGNGNMVKKTVENPKFSSDTYYDKGVTTYTYSRVYTSVDAPDLPRALRDSSGIGSSDTVNIPFDQTFASDDLVKQTGMYDYLGGRPYLY